MAFANFDPDESVVSFGNRNKEAFQQFLTDARLSYFIDVNKDADSYAMFCALSLDKRSHGRRVRHPGDEFDLLNKAHIQYHMKRIDAEHPDRIVYFELIYNPRSVQILSEMTKQLQTKYPHIRTKYMANLNAGNSGDDVNIDLPHQISKKDAREEPSTSSHIQKMTA